MGCAAQQTLCDGVVVGTSCTTFFGASVRMFTNKRQDVCESADKIKDGALCTWGTILKNVQHETEVG